MSDKLGSSARVSHNLVFAVGDVVEFAAAFLCQTHLPGGQAPGKYAAGTVVEVRSNAPFVRVWWHAGRDWIGTTTLVATSRLWAAGKGVLNECPRCAVGKCGGASGWRSWPVEIRTARKAKQEGGAA